MAAKFLFYIVCSSVSTVARIQARRPKILSSIPGRGKIFSLLHIIQTGSGVHQLPIYGVLGTLSPSLTFLEHEADH
jgi:hypothetical protein